MTQHLPIFVYGTLKRGEEREQMWPHVPVKVSEGTLRAALYDLGPYPALGPGDDCVVGELWFVREEHLRRTLEVLDRIECFGQGGVDLYVRRVVDCQDAAGTLQRAYAYFYADEEALKDVPRVPSDQRGECVWTAST